MYVGPAAAFDGSDDRTRVRAARPSLSPADVNPFASDRG
ncbi:hypothetical protein DM2_993 [Halorubrum sp. DM2]|nr:hypothetical protein DM2_993 [Halorubrum sp. DM2]